MIESLLLSLNFWYVWPIGIALLGLLAWGEFGIVEALAIKYPSSTHITLSYWVYYCSTKFPLAMVLGATMVGGFWVGLAVHFFWHYCPPGSVSAG